MRVLQLLLFSLFGLSGAVNAQETTTFQPIEEMKGTTRFTEVKLPVANACDSAPRGRFRLYLAHRNYDALLFMLVGAFAAGGSVALDYACNPDARIRAVSVRE